MRFTRVDLNTPVTMLCYFQYDERDTARISKYASVGNSTTRTTPVIIWPDNCAYFRGLHCSLAITTQLKPRCLYNRETRESQPTSSHRVFCITRNITHRLEHISKFVFSQTQGECKRQANRLRKGLDDIFSASPFRLGVLPWLSRNPVRKSFRGGDISLLRDIYGMLDSKRNDNPSAVHTVPGVIMTRISWTQVIGATSTQKACFPSWCTKREW